MSELKLNFNSKKSLCVHVGEDAGKEITALLEALIRKVEELERNKVDVIPIVPTTPARQVIPISDAA
ncbi:MAG: hypothetical protein CMJ64_12350 [Planctomycetaceae bacterium]|nr:hypothetical protein [Planctomycetaceae bacterium]